MKNKIMLGLSLLAPLTVMAMNLDGTHIYNEEINIPAVNDGDEEKIGSTGINILDNSNTTFNNKVTINMPKKDSFGILKFTLDGGPATTIFNDDLTIHMHEENATAIALIGGNPIVTVNGNTTLSVVGDNSNAIFVSNGELKLNGGSQIDGFIDVRDSGKLEINNKSIINSNIGAYYGGEIIMNLASGSKLTGRTVNSLGISDNNPGTIEINLAKNASWDITHGASFVSKLSGNGNIKFIDGVSSRSDTNNYGVLEIESLEGALNFDLRTDIVEQKGDKIKVYNKALGEHTINIINNGSSNTSGKEKLILVEIGDSAINGAEFKTTHTVELGGYQYDLNKEGNNWVLASNSTNPQKPQITTTANASVGFLNSNYLMSYVETQTLLKRLGDMRNSGKFGDVWLRGFSGKLNSFSGGKLNKFDMNYHGFQFGADKQLSDDSPFVVGTFVGQTYGDPNYRKGDGSLRSFNAGLYTSYININGFYFDVMGKYSRQRNHFKVKDTANNHIQGTGHTNGLGLSVELGKKFNFNDFYIEPQAQLSYTHQNDTLIHSTNGLKVKLGDYDSLIGRTSALFGYEINSENNKINLYAKTGIVREFDGDTYYKLNNSKESHSFKGNWWNNGVGVNALINNQHTIYFDLESSPGNKFDLLQVNGGYRYSF